MSKPVPQWRTDHLVCPLNKGKQVKVAALIRALRHTADLESSWQWERFFRGGWQDFESMAKKGWSRPWVKNGSVSTTHAQMVMAQVSAQLNGYWGNVRNSYTQLVSGSSLPANLRHQLHSIHAQQAWFREGAVMVKQEVWKTTSKGTPVLRKEQVEVSEGIRAAARCLIRRAMAMHRKPNFRQYQFQLDQRTVFLQDAHTATGFDQWLIMGTLVPGERIALPIQAHNHFLERQARAVFDQALDRAGVREDRVFEGILQAIDVAKADKFNRGSSVASEDSEEGAIHASSSHPAQKNRRSEQSEGTKKSKSASSFLTVAPERNPHPSRFALAKTVRLILSADQQSLTVSVATDMRASFEHSAATYEPRMGGLGLDLGMNTLFGTHLGDLLGRDWLTKIERYDRLLQGIARHRQRLGLKTASPRYRKIVTQLRGFLKTEIHRILNRLVQTRAPSHFVMEESGFYRNPRLSRRLNRLMSNMGAGILTEKLKDLEARFGITTTFVPAAYSSQACSSCHYVDKRNRPKQHTFHCKFCNTQLHADVNAPRNLLARRSCQPAASTPQGFVPRRHRKHLLHDLVSQFSERYTRPRGGPADPRWSNPYFKDWTDQVRSTEAASSLPSSGFELA